MPKIRQKNVFIAPVTLARTPRTQGRSMALDHALLGDCVAMDGRTDRWTERRRDRETERQRDRETERQRDRETERQRDRETERQRDRETERQRDRETERQKDRKTERQRAANAYLNDTILAMRNKVCSCLGPGRIPEEASQALWVPEEARAAWDRKLALHQKVMQFWDRSPDCYPLAAQVSRARGNTRGGDWISAAKDPSSYVFVVFGFRGAYLYVWCLGLSSETFLPLETCVSSCSREISAGLCPLGWMGWPHLLLLLSMHGLGSQCSLYCLEPLCTCPCWW